MIQIQLQPEIEVQLAAEAQARGMALEHYIGKFVEEIFEQKRAVRTNRRTAVERMLAFAGKHGIRLEGDDLKAMVHEGHKY